MLELVNETYTEPQSIRNVIQTLRGKRGIRAYGKYYPSQEILKVLNSYVHSDLGKVWGFVESVSYKGVKLSQRLLGIAYRATAQLAQVKPKDSSLTIAPVNPRPHVQRLTKDSGVLGLE